MTWISNLNLKLEYLTITNYRLIFQNNLGPFTWKTHYTVVDLLWNKTKFFNTINQNQILKPKLEFEIQSLQHLNCFMILLNLEIEIADGGGWTNITHYTVVNYTINDNIQLWYNFTLHVNPKLEFETQ